MSSPRCPALLSFLDARRDVTRQRWQVDQLIDAPCKGDVAQVSEDWHLEDMEEIQVWKVVDPLRVRPEVPKFPQRAAEQARQPDRECNPPVSRYQGCENTPAVLNQNDTVKYEKWAHPDQREEQVRCDEGYGHRHNAGRYLCCSESAEMVS